MEHTGMAEACMIQQRQDGASALHSSYTPKAEKVTPPSLVARHGVGREPSATNVLEAEDAAAGLSPPRDRAVRSGPPHWSSSSGASECPTSSYSYRAVSGDVIDCVWGKTLSEGVSGIEKGLLPSVPRSTAEQRPHPYLTSSQARYLTALQGSKFLESRDGSHIPPGRSVDLPQVTLPMVGKNVHLRDGSNVSNDTVASSSRKTEFPGFDNDDAGSRSDREVLAADGHQSVCGQNTSLPPCQKPPRGSRAQALGSNLSGASSVAGNSGRDSSPGPEPPAVRRAREVPVPEGLHSVLEVGSPAACPGAQSYKTAATNLLLERDLWENLYDIIAEARNGVLNTPEGEAKAPRE